MSLSKLCIYFCSQYLVQRGIVLSNDKVKKKANKKSQSCFCIHFSCIYSFTNFYTFSSFKYNTSHTNIFVILMFSANSDCLREQTVTNKLSDMRVLSFRKTQKNVFCQGSSVRQMHKYGMQRKQITS